MGAPLTGGEAAQLASAAPNGFPLGITIADGVVYWAEFGGGVVRAVRAPW